LTINDTVAISLTTNRALASAVANLLRAQGRSHEARAAFNPTLGSTLTYLRLNQGLNAQIGPTSITFVNEQQRTIGVQATLPIDISGILQATTDQAKFAEIASRLDINRVRNQVVQDIKTAFYDALRAQALAAVATENLRNSQSRLEDAEKRFSAGVVARFDVIRAQTDVANAKQQLIQTRNSVSLAIASLNSQIGIDINTALKLTNVGAIENPIGTETTLPVTPSSTAIDPNADPTSRIGEVAFDSLELGKEYDKIQKEALETRPEIWQAEANLSASKRGILLARRSELPSLGLNWQLSYTPDAAGLAPQVVQWQAVAQITLPLWDGATAKARKEQARADIAAAEVTKRDTADRIILDVRQAYLNLAQARDRVIVSNQVLTQAREAFRLARVRYNAGVSAQAGISPLLEVSDAQAALTQAESNQVNALYDYNNSRARLDRAIGRYSYTERGQGFPTPPTAKVIRK
jgi:outer membrane protein TolC